MEVWQTLLLGGIVRRKGLIQPSFKWSRWRSLVSFFFGQPGKWWGNVVDVFFSFANYKQAVGIFIQQTFIIVIWFCPVLYWATRAARNGGTGRERRAREREERCWGEAAATAPASDPETACIGGRTPTGPPERRECSGLTSALSSLCLHLHLPRISWAA